MKKEIINLRACFSQRRKIVMEESYAAQYGPGARVDDPHYQIIPGSRGHVYAWSATRLAASTSTSGSTASKLKTLPGVEVWQDGSDGCTVLFAVDLLNQVADLLRLRRRRQVTEEERERLAAIGHRHRFQPHQCGFQSDSEAQIYVPEAEADPKHVPDVATANGGQKRSIGPTGNCQLSIGRRLHLQHEQFTRRRTRRLCRPRSR
jgi:hypothetical protein